MKGLALEKIRCVLVYRISDDATRWGLPNTTPPPSLISKVRHWCPHSPAFDRPKNANHVNLHKLSNVQARLFLYISSKTILNPDKYGSKRVPGHLKHPLSLFGCATISYIIVFSICP